VEEEKEKICKIIKSIEEPKVLENLFALVKNFINYYSVQSRKNEAD